MIGDFIRTRISKSTLIEDLIIYYRIDSGVDVNLDDLIESRDANNKLAKGKAYCVLAESGDFTSFSKEVKEALSSYDYTKNRIALALLVHSFSLQIVANLYIKVNKPIGPTKIFKNKKEALKWLREKRDKHYEKQ